MHSLFRKQNKTMRSVQLQKAYDLAEKIDAYIEKNGWFEIHKGSKRFNSWVSVIHEEGTVFNYRNAYCIRHEDWLIIVPEHHDINVLAIDEVYDYMLLKHIYVPHAVFDGENLKEVVEHELETDIPF